MISAPIPLKTPTKICIWAIPNTAIPVYNIVL